MKTLSLRRWRFLQAVMTVVIAFPMMAWTAREAAAQPVSWDNSAGTFDQRWVYQFNWNPDVVPTSTSDVTLTAITPNLRIDAEGNYTSGCGWGCFHDPALKANSLTISTHNSFILDGSAAFDMTSLTLTSGDLTGQNTLSEEGTHELAVHVLLAADGAWDINGSGVLKVHAISESGVPRSFTKTGPGTLSMGGGNDPTLYLGDLFVSGTKTISQGIFEGHFRGAGTATIAPGAVFHIGSGTTDPSFGSGTTSPVILNGSGSGSASLVKVGAEVGELSGLLTIAGNPNIAVESGGTLLVSGGITSINNSGFGLFGPGELVLSGPGTGSILANLLFGGQLTIAHNNALGSGSVFGQLGAGLSFADGVTFANPISLVQGTIRGLGNSTVSSNVTLFPGNNHTLHVAQLGNTLAFTGTIADFGGGATLTKTGAGTVELSGSAMAAGGLTVTEGVLANHGSFAGGATRITGNALVTGTGQFADVNVQENSRLAPGASSDAGVFSPATLKVEDLAFAASTTSLLIQLGGVAPGSGFDQLLVSGNATLAGNLSVSLASGFALAANQSFRVIDVAGARSGQFAGLGEGALVGNFGGRDLFITYAGGNGNDVTLFTPGLGLTGDYNQNGTVDAADYSVWRNGLGTTYTQNDYNVWRAHFGQTAGNGSGANVNTAIPEPATLGVLMLAMSAWCLLQSRVA